MADHSDVLQVVFYGLPLFRHLSSKFTRHCIVEDSGVNSEQLLKPISIVDLNSRFCGRITSREYLGIILMDSISDSIFIVSAPMPLKIASCGEDRPRLFFYFLQTHKVKPSRLLSKG